MLHNEFSILNFLPCVVFFVLHLIPWKVEQYVSEYSVFKKCAKRISSSSHWKLSCSRHVIAEKFLSWRYTTVTHWLTHSIYGFWLPPLVSSNSRPLYCLSYDLRLLITPLVSSNSRPLCCLSYDLRLLITPLVSSSSRPLCCLSYDLRLLISIFKLYLSLVSCSIAQHNSYNVLIYTLYLQIRWLK